MPRFALLTAVENRRWLRPHDYFSLIGWEALLGAGESVRLSSREGIPPDVDLTGVQVALAIGEAPPTSLVRSQLSARGIKLITIADHFELRHVEPEWWVSCPPLAYGKAKPVLCADESDQASSLWKKAREEALLLPTTAAALGRVGKPGINTLFAPFFPEAHLKAIASASRVIAMDAVTARTAQALRVPAKNYGPGGKGLELPPLTATALLAKRAEQRRRVAQHFSLPQTPTQKAETDSSFLNVACAVDWAAVPQFLGLATRLREVHGPNLRFYCLTQDEKAHAFISASPLLNGGKVYRESDLWNADDIRVVKRRTAALRRLTAKPKLLARALEASRETVIYCDLNLHFYESPAPWANMASHEAIKICPARNPSVEKDWQYGLFQSGLVAVNSRAEVFLDWWAKLNFVACETTSPRFEDHFEDQGYLDLAPTLFAEFKIDWTNTHNVAPWSEPLLRLAPDSQCPWRPVALGARVASYRQHSVRQDSAVPEFGFVKTAWDQLACFFSAYPWRKAERLLRPVAQSQAEFFGPLALVMANPWLGESAGGFDWMAKRPWRGALAFIVTRGVALKRKWRTFRTRQIKMPLSPCNSLTPQSSIS